MEKTSSCRIKQFFARELSRYERLCPKDCPIWQARFYDYNVESDKKLNEKLEYMHNNPVVVSRCKQGVHKCAIKVSVGEVSEEEGLGRAVGR